jgi:hypothetical protein
LAWDEHGRVYGITADDTIVLPLRIEVKKKKKSGLSLDNLSGYLDIDVIKKSKLLHIMHNLVCPHLLPPPPTHQVESQ